MSAQQEQRFVRVITLGSGASFTLGAYATAWKRARQAMLDGVPALNADLVGASHQFRNPTEVVLRQFRDGMQDRINRHDPAFGKGRKWTPDWQFAARRVAEFANAPQRERNRHWREQRALPPDLKRLTGRFRPCR